MKKFRISLIILPLLFMASLTACNNSEKEKPVEASAMDSQPFVIGLIPERNIFKQLEHYQALAAYLSYKIGKKVELTILSRYGNIIDNFVSLKLDAAFFGSFTYSLAHDKLGVEVIARPETPSGESTYHGLIFTRKDSGIKSVSDMKGKTIALVDKATTAGYLFPLAYLKENGVADYKTFFKEVYYTGTHEDAIHDVLNKKADIGAAKNTIFRDLQKHDQKITSQLLILGRSLDVPENGLAVKRELAPALKNKLKQALLNMHDDPNGLKVLEDFGAKRFLETSNDDYVNVYLLCQKLGLDLKTYDYIND